MLHSLTGPFPGSSGSSEACPTPTLRLTLTVLVGRWLQGVEDALGAIWREARAACWAGGARGSRAPHLSRKPAGPWWPQEACNREKRSYVKAGSGSQHY